MSATVTGEAWHVGLGGALLEMSEDASGRSGCSMQPMTFVLRSQKCPQVSIPIRNTRFTESRRQNNCACVSAVGRQRPHHGSAAELTATSAMLPEAAISLSLKASLRVTSAPGQRTDMLNVSALYRGVCSPGA